MQLPIVSFAIGHRWVSNRFVPKHTLHRLNQGWKKSLSLSTVLDKNILDFMQFSRWLLQWLKNYEIYEMTVFWVAINCERQNRKNIYKNEKKPRYLRTMPTFVSAQTFCWSRKAWFKVAQKSNVSVRSLGLTRGVKRSPRCSRDFKFAKLTRNMAARGLLLKALFAPTEV